LVAEFLIVMAPSFGLLLDADEIPCGTVWKATQDLDRCSGYSPHTGLNSAAQIRRQSAAAFPANPIVEHAANLLRQRNAVKAKNPII
jgi:hypothetical protein